MNLNILVLEVPVSVWDKRKVFKIFAKPYSISDIYNEMKNINLEIKNIYFFLVLFS